MTIKKKLYSIIFILNIFCSFIFQINGQIIIPLKKNLNSYYIKIFYDQEIKKSEYVKINMALDFSFIPLPQLSDAKIEYENEIIEIDNKEFNTKLISCNNFYLENNTNFNLKSFTFYSLPKAELNKDFINKVSTRYADLYQGQLGLSPIYEDDFTNILYILKKKELIKKMSFGISFNYKEKKEDILFFGEIENNNIIKKDLIKNKNVITKFDMNKKLVKKYNKWGFKLDAIVIEKTDELIKNIKHKYFSYFNIIEDRIFVPDKILEYFISRIFSTYIKNKICFVTEYSDKKFINCYKNKLIKEKLIFPNIIFVVDNHSFKLTYDDLFINSPNNNEIIFIIQKNYYDIDTSIILFGSRFLKKYITEFDLEQNQIIFHSENILPNVNLDKIEDDSWKDMIRDYNKEIEHYDSNYGNEKEEEDNSDINYDNEDNESDQIDKNDLNKNSDNKDKEKEEGKIKDNDNNKKEKSDIVIDYGIYFKYFVCILIIIIIFFGIFIFFKVRKNIRINKEKPYFKQPFNEEKVDE